MTIVAVAQFAPSTDKDGNLCRLEAFAREAVEGGADLVVFPEYSSWFAPRLDEDFLAAAEPSDGPFGIRLARIAAGLGVTIVAGMLESAPDDDDRRVSNTIIAVSPEGSRLATYRKIHLYDAFGARESEWLRPGEIGTPETFRMGGLTFGLQTCYDLRFPEVSRCLVDAGVQVVVMPAEWVAGPNKVEHWTTLCKARAIENTAYLVAADHAAPVGVGASLIVDPLGRTVALAGDEEQVLTAQLDAELVASVRATNPALQLRRFRVVPA